MRLKTCSHLVTANAVRRVSQSCSKICSDDWLQQVNKALSWNKPYLSDFQLREHLSWRWFFQVSLSAWYSVWPQLAHVSEPEVSLICPFPWMNQPWHSGDSQDNCCHQVNQVCSSKFSWFSVPWNSFSLISTAKLHMLGVVNTLLAPKMHARNEGV